MKTFFRALWCYMWGAWFLVRRPIQFYDFAHEWMKYSSGIQEADETRENQAALYATTNRRQRRALMRGIK